jgi:putative spermidine/putrescine transport system permease protein
MERTAKINFIGVIFYIYCLGVFLFLILPLFVVLPISISSAKYLEFPPRGISLQWYEQFFRSKEWVRATLNSLKIATMTSLFATLLGIPAALTLARHRFKGKQVIYSLLLSPMIIPVIIVAIAIYFFFAGFKLVDNIYSLALAHTILALPVVLITVSAALQGFDQTLEYAAMSLGANRLKTFFKVTLPLIRPGVITGALFAFITSFDEIVIAIFLSGSRAITLPRRMWSSIREEIDPTIAAVSSILIISCVLLLLSVAALRRRSERLKGGD